MGTGHQDNAQLSKIGQVMSETLTDPTQLALPHSLLPICLFAPQPPDVHLRSWSSPFSIPFLHNLSPFFENIHSVAGGL